ncbi:MAG TPA: hypothetical protein VJ884_02845 [Salinibacter sp.]|nr:hypothetical protein [Salinibacter sp.]
MSDEKKSVRSGRFDDPTREEASYRERLESSSLLLGEDEEQSPEAAQPDVEALRMLVESTGRKGTAFQSVAVAAVQILERALCYEREAAEAALSLGQQEKLASMVDTIERAAAVLRGTLTAECGNVVHLCAKGDRPAPTDGQPWWFALTDALEVLEEGTGRMTSLTTAQPDGSPARELSQLIAQLLRGHHDELLLEADDWIS